MMDRYGALWHITGAPAPDRFGGASNPKTGEMHMRPTILLLASLTLYATACASTRVAPTRSDPRVDVQADDERSIYLAALALEQERYTGRSLIVVEDTRTTASGESIPPQDALAELGVRVSPSALEALFGGSRPPLNLRSRLGSVSKVIWIDVDKAGVYRAHSSEGVRELSKAYPEAAPVIFSYSVVGFDRNGGSAALLVSDWCGQLCGGKRLIALVRSSEGWRVSGHVPLTIS